MTQNFLIISISLFVFILSIILLRKRGEAEDTKKRMMKSITSKDKIKIEYAELNESFSKRFIAPIFKKVTERIEEQKKIREEKDNQLENEKKINKIHEKEHLLRMSGVHTSYQNYQFAKLAFSIIFIVFVIGITFILQPGLLYTVLFCLMGVVLGLVLPDFILKSMVSSHQQKIKQQLPDVLDLLSVCMEAGLSFDNSLLKISEKMTGPFVDELMTVFRQMQMGVSRNDALNSLADCTDIKELKTFVSSLIQANQLGIPVNNVMKVQSKQLRNTRRETAKEKGNKAPTKMAIPIMVFIFPCLFIMILGPTVINMMTSMK